jgi:tetratricopeptide (TPR) repeat protein
MSATASELTATDRARCEEGIADLLAEAAGTDEVETRGDCLRQVAALYERQLADLPRALVAWQAAFSVAPDSDEAGLAIERLTSALGQWAVMLPELEALLEDVAEPASRAALLRWLARWSERFLDDDSLAEQRLLEAVQLAPASLDGVEALSALYRKQGDWARAAEVCRRAGMATTDVEASVGLLLEAARIIHGRVGDTEGAMQLYRRVLDLDPRNGTAADALAEASGSNLEPAVICARYRQALEVDPANLNVLRQWADVAFSHARLDDLRHLFAVLFERAGGTASAKLDSRARLNEALERFVAAERWGEAVDVLRTLARESEGPLAAKYYLAAGKIAQHELRDRATALDLYQRAFDVHPEDGKIVERVFAMLSEIRAWTDAEAALRAMVARLREAGKADDSSVAVPVWRRLGDVYRTGLRDPARASEAYKECARLAPQDRYGQMVAEMARRSPVLAALDARGS